MEELENQRLRDYSTIEGLIERYGKPILQFVPDAKYFNEWESPVEVCVFDLDLKNPGGCIVFARFGNNQWHANACERFAIRHLIDKLNEQIIK